MKPDKLTIHNPSFQKERRYVVPLYQRAYIWNRTDQWEPLWEDIERQAEACLAAENHVSRRAHFLGAIVLNVAKIVGSSVARSEIIRRPAANSPPFSFFSPPSATTRIPVTPSTPANSPALRQTRTSPLPFSHATLP